VRTRARLLLTTLGAFWAEYAREVAHYQAAIWLGLVYFLVLGPTWLVLRLLGKPLLPSTFGRGGSHWRPRAPVQRDLASLQRPF
jgi:hypothetical protein